MAIPNKRRERQAGDPNPQEESEGTSQPEAEGTTEAPLEPDTAKEPEATEASKVAQSAPTEAETPEQGSGVAPKVEAPTETHTGPESVSEPEPEEAPDNEEVAEGDAEGDVDGPPAWEARIRGVAAFAAKPGESPAKPPQNAGLLTLADNADTDTPWAGEKRESAKRATLTIAEVAWEQLRWLADRVPQSQNQILRNILEPAIDELARQTFATTPDGAGHLQRVRPANGHPRWETEIRKAWKAATKGPSRPNQAEAIVTVDPQADRGTPWGPYSRTDLIHSSISMAYASWAQLRWLNPWIPQSQNQLMRNLVEPALDALAWQHRGDDDDV